MRAASFAGNKTKLAQALGIGRSLLYQFARMTDFPPPRATGMWHIPTVRAFITKKRRSVKASEKEQVQIALLNARLEREGYELQEQRRATRDQIQAEFTASLETSMRMLRVRFDQMVQELCPQFVGLDAGAIRKLWRERQAQAYAEIVKWFNEKTGTTVSVESTEPGIVPFKAASA